MAYTYTVSSCFLENADIFDVTGVLDELSNKVKGHQVARDKNGEIIDIYKRVKTKYFSDLIIPWLNKLACYPKSIKQIEIDLSQIDCIKEKFLILCIHTADKILIVNSRDDYTKFGIEGQQIILQSKLIKVLNKSEAQEELNREEITHIDTLNNMSGKGNMFAGGNIENSKNKPKF